MYFTYNENKIYELRNSVKSCVKRMPNLALIYDNVTYKLEEYGSIDEMELRLLSFANRKIYNKEMVKSDSWDLVYLNKLVDNKISFKNIDQGIDKNFADKFRTVYYRNPKIHLC